MFKQSFTFSVILLFLLSCETPYDALKSLKKDVGYLAADSLSGREFGTEGEKKAADFLTSEFKKIGLSPAGTDGFYQPFYVKKSDNPHEKAAIGDSLGTKGYNVLGMIDNPSDEIIVIGAHFDHLGMGSFSSLHRGEEQVHNGADDNASGTAALLHLARVLSKKQLNRDILFFAISGEEKGLWGSNYFVKNPTLDLSKVNYMVNMDMVGRLDTTKGLAVHGVGTAEVWSGVLDIANTDNIKLIKKESGTGPSDHTSFYLQDISVLHFFTGQHEDYHKPGDDAEKLNYGGILQVANLIERLVVDLDDEESLAFIKTKDESSNTPRFTVTLGVVPDYLFDGKGMRIDGVSEDKPAQKAGIVKGDIVIQMGDSTINDMMSYMRTLSSFQSGDKTMVTIDRAGEKLEVEVEF
ncbi:MAG: M28 family peptidase [Cyclobacteriaceae bacterium]